ncbi:MAG: hypothetical protein ACI9JL_004574 [Paracoccaceae bacterium]|jgi:hypothetical protein
MDRNPSFPDYHCKHWIDPVPPETHRLVADVDAAFKQQVLDLTQRLRISTPFALTVPLLHMKPHQNGSLMRY